MGKWLGEALSGTNIGHWHHVFYCGEGKVAKWRIIYMLESHGTIMVNGVLRGIRNSVESEWKMGKSDFYTITMIILVVLGSPGISILHNVTFRKKGKGKVGISEIRD